MRRVCALRTRSYSRRVTTCAANAESYAWQDEGAADVRAVADGHRADGASAGGGRAAETSTRARAVRRRSARRGAAASAGCSDELAGGVEPRYSSGGTGLECCPARCARRGRGLRARVGRRRTGDPPFARSLSRAERSGRASRRIGGPARAHARERGGSCRERHATTARREEEATRPLRAVPHLGRRQRRPTLASGLLARWPVARPRRSGPCQNAGVGASTV